MDFPNVIIYYTGHGDINGNFMIEEVDGKTYNSISFEEILAIFKQK